MKTIINFEGKRHEIEQRNVMHFEIQKKTRVQIVKSKKIYNRKRDKKVSYSY